MLEVQIWLILPVVICLSQRLSHACVSAHLCEWQTAFGSLYQLLCIWVLLYMDSCGNSTSNTCHSCDLLEQCALSFQNHPVASMGMFECIWVNKFQSYYWKLIIAISDLSASDGKVLAYHGNDGWREIRVWFRRGGLRDGHHIQGRQQARKLPNPDTGR